MTQPIQEPSVDRAVQGLAYARDQIFRRPAPSGSGTAVVHMLSWNYDTDNTVPNTTWTPVANLAGGGGFYEDILSVPSGQTSMSWDCGDGTIVMNDEAEYECEGWVQFNESPVVNNESRIVALDFGSSFRIINVYTFDIAHGTIAEHPLVVQTHSLQPQLSGGVFLECWQNSGGDLTIRDAEILVRRFEFGTAELCLT